MPPPDDPDAFTEKLVQEFGDSLDASLIYAIAGDRDVIGDYDEVRAILLSLSGTAGAEEATGFDPSGLGSCSDRVVDDGSWGDAVVSHEGRSASGSLATDDTTTASSTSDEARTLSDQSGLTDEEKVSGLRLIFPVFQDHTLEFALRTAGGDLDRAFEELLTRQALHESGELPKGVDAFCVEDDKGRPVKSRGGGQGGRRKVKNRTVLELDYKVVSETVDDEELHDGQSPVGQQQPAQARGKAVRAGTDNWASRAVAAPSSGSGPSFPSFAARHEIDGRRATQRAVRNLARLGPLARQGASVYTDRGRTHSQIADASELRRAEEMVAAQRTPLQIDLHGVQVLHGVRIALDYVRAWWDSLDPAGRRRVASGQRGGFTVVTGVGIHSPGGVSQLRQAVGAALKNDGWRVEPLTGKFYIDGKL